MDITLGEATPLNLGESSGLSDAGALKRTLDLLTANAFDLTRGRIDYTRLKDDPGYTAYKTQVASLRSFSLGSLNAPDDRTAFWLNIYNALTVDAVIAFGIKETVREVPRLGFFRKAAYEIDRQLYSLDDIEHGVLRGNRRHPAYPLPQFDQDDPRIQSVLPLDPRIHFAMTCASRSCPPISFYDAKKISSQLDMAMSSFLSGGGCDVDVTQRTATLSSIFKWYAGDFGGAAGVLDFLARHHPNPSSRAALADRAHPPRVIYAPYDWRLNKG